MSDYIKIYKDFYKGVYELRTLFPRTEIDEAIEDFKSVNYEETLDDLNEFFELDYLYINKLSTALYLLEHVDEIKDLKFDKVIVLKDKLDKIVLNKKLSFNPITKIDNFVIDSSSQTINAMSMNTPSNLFSDDMFLEIIKLVIFANSDVNENVKYDINFVPDNEGKLSNDFEYRKGIITINKDYISVLSYEHFYVYFNNSTVLVLDKVFSFIFDDNIELFNKVISKVL